MEKVISAIIKKLGGKGHQIIITRELTLEQISSLRYMGYLVFIDGFGTTIKS